MQFFNNKYVLFFVAVIAYFACVCQADFNFAEKDITPMGDKEKVLASLNSTTGGPYTYSQSAHHFYGTAYDGSWIDTTGCCCGQSGSCRNNPSCQCQVSVGPLPQGTYTLGNMETFKGMPYCYQLYPSSSNNMCGRSGFLIHGGGCSGNPSEGCIVIESESTRYMIKSGATLKVVA
jgi:hypothetical protein